MPRYGHAQSVDFEQIRQQVLLNRQQNQPQNARGWLVHAIKIFAQQYEAAATETARAQVSWQRYEFLASLQPIQDATRFEAARHAAAEQWRVAGQLAADEVHERLPAAITLLNELLESLETYPGLRERQGPTVAIELNLIRAACAHRLATAAMSAEGGPAAIDEVFERRAAEARSSIHGAFDSLVELTPAARKTVEPSLFFWTDQVFGSLELLKAERQEESAERRIGQLQHGLAAHAASLTSNLSPRQSLWS